MVVFGGGGWEYSLVSGYVLRRRKKGGGGGYRCVVECEGERGGGESD